MANPNGNNTRNALLFVIICAITFGACSDNEDEQKIELSKIEITKKPVKLMYFIDDPLDLNGMEVKAIYNDASSSTVTDYTTDGFDSAEAGEYEITVTYKDKITHFDVSVRRMPKSISITTPPEKTEYLEGDFLSLKGMIVTASFGDGTKEEVTGYTAHGFNSSAPGETTVTIRYGSKADNFTLMVSEYETTEKKLYWDDVLGQDLDSFNHVRLVVIVLDNKTSLNLHSYKQDDFPELPISRIEDLTPLSTEIVRRKLNAETTGDLRELESINSRNDTLFNRKTFRRILCLELPESKDFSTKDAIRLLEQRSELLFVGLKYSRVYNYPAGGIPDHENHPGISEELTVQVMQDLLNSLGMNRYSVHDPLITYGGYYNGCVPLLLITERAYPAAISAETVADVVFWYPYMMYNACVEGRAVLSA